jgi:uncharacterized membrane protein
MRKMLFALAGLGLALAPAVAAASMQSTAVAALVSYERTHEHNTDVESPQCYVLETWAQCSFGTGHGNAEVNAWFHYKNGSWAFLGSGGGVTNAQQLEAWGIPASIARQFQAKQ